MILLVRKLAYHYHVYVKISIIQPEPNRVYQMTIKDHKTTDGDRSIS